MSSLQSQLRDAVDRSYVMAFSYRSGSTFVVGDLARSGLGRPTEYFQTPRYEESGLAVADYVLQTVATESVDGLFGCKISWEEGATLLRRLEAEGAVAPGTTLDELFPDVRFLHLTRTDTLAQAVSWWRARHTGEWHRPTGTAAPEVPAPPLDVRGAAHRYLQVAAETSLWDGWFRRRGIEPLRLNYERWCEDRPGSVESVAAFLGVVPPSPVPVADDLQVLRDDWSDAAASQLWAFLSGPTEPDWVGADPGDGSTLPLGLPCPP